jgi:hypothetical protein
MSPATFKEANMANHFYGVEINTEGRLVISRYFQTLRAARRYAKWCQRTWATRILRGGAGGQEVAI